MNKFKNLTITSLYLFCLEIVFAILIYHHISLLNMILYFLGSITLATLLSFISLLIPNKGGKVFLIIIYSFITLIYMAQYVHYHFYDCFFSIYSLFHGGQVFGFVPAIIKIIISNLFGFLVLFAFLITIIIALIKTNDEKTNNKKRITFSIFIISLLISSLSILIPSNSVYSRKNLLFKTNVETENVQRFGLSYSMVLDLNRFMFGYSYDLYDSKNSNKEYSKDKYNILDTKFGNSDNKEINKLNKYLKNSKPTNKNKYTGIFKNKNLIFITAESFSFSAIDKKLTPTLYKLYNEGFTFNNFYTPIYYASTSDGEYTNLTGLLPKEGVWSYMDTVNKSFPLSYSSSFEKYDKYAYHNGEYDFYRRNEVMTSLGYKFTACGNGLEKKINCILWPQSDDEMISSTFSDYKDSKHFVTYYMSISGHLNHNFKDNDMAKKYKSDTLGLPYSTATRAYLSATIDLDKALEHLLDNLEKEKLLDDTVIVLAPDHFPYGLSKKEYSDLRKLDKPYDKHKSGLIIYNKSTGNIKIDKYASNIDILPTLLNMFGIDYDSRLLVGKDIMSNSDGIVMFNDRSFLTDKGFYNEKTNRFYRFVDDIPTSYVKEKQKEVFNKFNASAIILDNNYYKTIKSYSEE